MNEPIRVLQIVGNMGVGGIETLVMNLYRNIDRSKVQFDFLIHNKTDGEYSEEAKKMGGRFYHMPVLKDKDKTYYWRYFEYKSALKKFFIEHKEYKIIHGHMTNTMAIYGTIAKKYGSVKCCIAHSHSTGSRPGLSGIVTDFLHKDIPKIATDYFSCSEMAAHWIFPDELIEAGKVRIIKNGVNPLKFAYSENEADLVKRELGIEGKYVIGNVARFKTEKNHSFIIDIFKEYHKINSESVLLLVGDGELRNQIEEKVRVLKLDKFVHFLGIRSDVNRLMIGMDLFLLPSLCEGLPVVGIEAQAAGLPVLTSTGVTKETDITGNVTFLDLDKGAKYWANSITDISNKYQRKNMGAYIKENGYDITETAKWLQNFYLSQYEDLR